MLMTIIVLLVVVLVLLLVRWGFRAIANAAGSPPLILVIVDVVLVGLFVVFVLQETGLLSRVMR